MNLGKTPMMKTDTFFTYSIFLCAIRIEHVEFYDVLVIAYGFLSTIQCVVPTAKTVYIKIGSRQYENNSSCCFHGLSMVYYTH